MVAGLSSRAKGTIYRGGVQVPLVIGGGAVVEGGRTVSAMVQLSDLHATLLELAGLDVDALRAAVAPEAAYDSISFAPWITAPATATPARSRLLAQAFPNADPDPLSMRHTWTDGRWKIACRAGATQLYDLSVDPWEGTDLLDTESPDPEVLGVMNSFREELEAFMGVEGLCPYGDESEETEASE